MNGVFPFGQELAPLAARTSCKSRPVFGSLSERVRMQPSFVGWLLSTASRWQKSILEVQAAVAATLWSSHSRVWSSLFAIWAGPHREPGECSEQQQMLVLSCATPAEPRSVSLEVNERARQEHQVILHCRCHQLVGTVICACRPAHELRKPSCRLSP